MIIVTRKGVTPDELDHIRERIEGLGLRTHVSQGEERTIVGCVGDEARLHGVPLLSIPGVEAVHEVMVKDAEGEDTSAVDYLVAYQWIENEYQEVRVEIGLESNNRVEILVGFVEDDEVSLEASKKYKEFRDKEEEVKEEDNKTKTE